MPGPRQSTELAERGSLSADELSSSQQGSSGELTTAATSNANANAQASLHFTDLTGSQASFNESLRSSELEWNQLESGEDRLVLSREDRPMSGEVMGRPSQQAPPSLGDTSSAYSNQLSDMDFGQPEDESHNLEEEERFLREVESYIGNPEDWSDSDNESIQGDLSGVRVFEWGLIEEEFPGEEYFELFDESFPLPSPGPMENMPDFLYDNDSGRFTLLAYPF